MRIFGRKASFSKRERIKSSIVAFSFEYEAAIFTLQRIISFNLLLIPLYTHFLSSVFSLKLPFPIISRTSFSFIP